MPHLFVELGRPVSFNEMIGFDLGFGDLSLIGVGERRGNFDILCLG